MNITVILCTYNRCQILGKALASVALSRLPESVEWEVLVVDDNSNDRTADVVADFRRRYLGRFRYLFNPQSGKSNSLNKGIAEAKGEVLAFMDDDVTVEPTWLQRLTTPVLEGKGTGCGGRILPEWSCTPPQWLPDSGRHPLAPLAVFDLGLEAGRLTEAPFGTNMAFHKSVFVKYGGFRTDLGPGAGGKSAMPRTASLAAVCSLRVNNCGMNHRRLYITRCRRIDFDSNTFWLGGSINPALTFGRLDYLLIAGWSSRVSRCAYFAVLRCVRLDGCWLWGLRVDFPTRYKCGRWLGKSWSVTARSILPGARINDVRNLISNNTRTDAAENIHWEYVKKDSHTHF